MLRKFDASSKKEMEMIKTFFNEKQKNAKKKYM